MVSAHSCEADYFPSQQSRDVNYIFRNLHYLMAQEDAFKENMTQNMPIKRQQDIMQALYYV
jgi:hypothetical protein